MFAEFLLQYPSTNINYLHSQPFPCATQNSHPIQVTYLYHECKPEDVQHMKGTGPEKWEMWRNVTLNVTSVILAAVCDVKILDHNKL